jgi:D-alanyl-D-alanine carboxypeptidase (penicillin-binding protein 5/6)
VRTLVLRLVPVLLAACCTTAVAGTAGASVAPGVIGGPLLASHGIVVNHASSPAPRLPAVQASAFVVADATTGAVLAARDPHGRYLPASTLKVLTAVALIPVLNANATTVADAFAASTVPNVAGLIPGQRYPISGLFTALLTISANDAAIALAQAAGGYSQGIALLNATAARLEARDTHAVNPNGLNARGQLTSAYDLALIARQALAMPAFMRYDQVRSAPFRVKPGKRAETLFNQNKLLTGYPGGIGGKIGWTAAAGATYVGMARRGDVTLIVTLLHCPSLTEITSAEKLLTWGFAADGKVAPVGALVRPLSAERAPGTRAGSGPRATPAGIAKAGGAHVSASGLRAVFPPSTIVAMAFTMMTSLVITMAIVATRRQRRRR